MSDIKILFVFFLWPSTCSLACGWGGGGHPTAHRPPHLSKTTTPLKDHHTSQKTTSPPHLSKDHHTSQKTTTPLKRPPHLSKTTTPSKFFCSVPVVIFCTTISTPGSGSTLCPGGLGLDHYVQEQELWVYK